MHGRARLGDRLSDRASTNRRLSPASLEPELSFLCQRPQGAIRRTCVRRGAGVRGGLFSEMKGSVPEAVVVACTGPMTEKFSAVPIADVRSGRRAGSWWESVWSTLSGWGVVWG